jgi:hypothetical protein
MRFQNAIRNTFFGAAAILSTAASAATLSVNADKLTYLVGETITLTVTGDPQGDGSYQVYGRLLYTGPVPNDTRAQFKIGPSWILDPTLDAGSGFSEAFSQVTVQPFDTVNLPGLISTVTLIATTPGIVDISWETTGIIALDFFGLTNAPGTSFTIVPEPTTATLLVLALLGLAGWRRASA